MTFTARDVSGSHYIWRFLRPSQARAIAAAKAAGVPASQLAKEYGVTVRTIYRMIERASEDVIVVRVGSWRAEFSLTDDGPVRMTEWYADPAA